MIPLRDRLRAVIEEYCADIPLARNWVLSFQLFFTNDEMELIGATLNETITGKVAPPKPKPVDNRKRRVVITDAKLKVVENDIKRRRMLAGPEQPVVKHAPSNAFMYQERDRE